MQKTLIIIIGVIVLVALGWWALGSLSGNAGNTNTAGTQPTGTIPVDQMATTTTTGDQMSSGTPTQATVDTSDSGIDQSLNNIDTQMSGLQSDSSNSDTSGQQ